MVLVFVSHESHYRCFEKQFLNGRSPQELFDISLMYDVWLSSRIVQHKRNTVALFVTFSVVHLIGAMESVFLHKLILYLLDRISTFAYTCFYSPPLFKISLICWAYLVCSETHGAFNRFWVAGFIYLCTYLCLSMGLL